MATKKEKKYYVIHTSKDIGYYHTVYWVVCITEDEDVAKDLCKKFGYHYHTEIVGENRATPNEIKRREEHTDEIRGVVKEMMNKVSRSW
jgi:hypothetical protein